MDLFTIIKKERLAGYLDSVVFGGFGAYLSQWAEDNHLDKLAILGKEYSSAPKAYRPQLLDAIERELQNSKITPLVEIGNPISQTVPVSALSAPLVSLKGIGEKRAQLFAKLGVNRVSDLLELYPRDYRDRRKLTRICDAQLGETITIRGLIVSCDLVRARRSGMAILSCIVKDDSGSISAVWFNQPFLQKKLQAGRQIQIYGRVEQRYGQPDLIVMEYQMGEEMDASLGLIPVYPATEGLSQKAIRSAIELAWKKVHAQVQPVLPSVLLQKRSLMEHVQALEIVHFPQDLSQLEAARRSLVYEELIQVQLAILLNTPGRNKVQRPPCDDQQLLADFTAALSFPLTAAQQRVIHEIYADMSADSVMARLVQGDVGSGKTIVAAAAIVKCCRQGRQAALMAPTEILARQHAANLSPLLNQLGLRTALLTGRTTAAERNQIVQQLRSGDLDCLIGTHALIQQGVEFHNMGLAITDEQHRFGVAQRAKLRGAEQTDVLIMSATPIPRTLAMTLYADLHISVIDELPPGRRPVKTYAVGYSYEQRIYRFIDKEISQGRQAYVVCPLVEDSDIADLNSATRVYENLSRNVFPQRRVSLLHGRMKAAEKEQDMQDFRDGNCDILVATTVIEVGVDVPNATVMLICDAERFGLAQLHQLRGRIGRGAAQSYCILLHNARSQVAQSRMRIITSTTDGFRLAEADLEQRGAGEIFGQRQHGLPELRIANVFRDAALLEPARQDAIAITQGQMDMPPILQKRVDKLLSLMT